MSVFRMAFWLVRLVFLVLVIIWTIGELRIHGYAPVDVWTTRTAEFATWVNIHFGGKT